MNDELHNANEIMHLLYANGCGPHNVVWINTLTALLRKTRDSVDVAQRDLVRGIDYCDKMGWVKLDGQGRTPFAIRFTEPGCRVARALDKS